MASSADSATVYAAGIHVPLQRYVVDPDRVAVRVGDRVHGGGELTRAQWRTYLSDAPYRKVCAGWGACSTEFSDQRGY
ncbi:hypothetical protein ACWGH3_02730 [Streptomyces sp. NPDC054884]